MLQEIDLSAHHALANLEDRLLPLLDILHELDRGRVTLLHIIADVAVGFLIAIEHPAILRIEP